MMKQHAENGIGVGDTRAYVCVCVVSLYVGIHQVLTYSELLENCCRFQCRFSQGACKIFFHFDFLIFLRYIFFCDYQIKKLNLGLELQLNSL